MPHAAVRALLLRDGPVVLEVNARTLKSVDARGRVQDLTPRPSNHAVCVVGWEGDCWIVRNSWGTPWGETGFARVVTSRNRGPAGTANNMLEEECAFATPTGYEPATLATKADGLS